MTSNPPSHWAPEKLMELSVTNLEAAKKDLEKNWMSQLFALGASLAVILGLGKLISERVFGAVGYESILYLLLPMANLYLFLRFGNLLSTFSEARFAAQTFFTNFYANAQSRGLPVDAAPEPSAFYKTNSYFEYYHYSDANWGMFVYMLLVPVVLTLNNVTSLYMLYIFMGRSIWGYFLDLLLIGCISALYYAYYASNKDRQFAYMTSKFNFILFAYLVISVAGLVLLVSTVKLGVPFSLKAGAGSVSADADWSVEDFVDGF